MKEESTQATEGGIQENLKGQGEYKAPTTQAELDRIIESRLSRERAKYSNYEEYKAAHEKLLHLEEAENPELQKWLRRLDKAEAASQLAQKADALLKEVMYEPGVNQASRNGTGELFDEKENKELYQIVVNIVTTY